MEYMDYDNVPHVIQPPSTKHFSTKPSVQLDSNITYESVPHVIQPKSTPNLSRENVPHVIHTPPASSLILERDSSIPTVSGGSVIQHERDVDNISDEEFFQYIEYLQNEQTKYDIFSRLFPDHTCEGIRLRIDPLVNARKTQYVNVSPSLADLIACIKDKEHLSKELALLLVHGDQTNIIWFDTENHVINRYDPLFGYSHSDQMRLDHTLENFFQREFPEYHYLGNTIDQSQCLPHEQYCQEYTLLYAINRVNGMTHDEAVDNLSNQGSDIEAHLRALLHTLVRQTRTDMGKTV
jgi:hypothetical protein